MKECQKNGIEWRHIDLKGAKKEVFEEKEVQDYLKPKLKEIFDDLSDTPHRVLLHCAAGMHRTGTCTFALLRHQGMTFEEAEATLHGLRSLTGQNVLEWRLKYAEDNFI